MLALAANAFFGALTDSVTGDLYEKLKSMHARRAFESVLAASLTKYATNKPEALIWPLMEKHGIFTLGIVAEELSQFIKFERRPNVELIAEIWESKLPADIAATQNLPEETATLLRSIESELRDNDVFRPIFETKDLWRIADTMELNAATLRSIESSLFTVVNAYQSSRESSSWARQAMRSNIHDYRSFIREKTDGFLGRAFVFKRINQFLETHERGRILLTGDPGIGKTAFVAQLVKTHNYFHHFNIRAEGINTPAKFIQNICSQLFHFYGLTENCVPEDSNTTSSQLSSILDEVSLKLQGAGKCIIVVDALDEAENPESLADANILLLPSSIPEGIFFIATSRSEEVRWRLNVPELLTIALRQDDAENISDIRQFIVSRMAREGVQNYIRLQGIAGVDFAGVLTEKSQGNFIYLRLVLNDIESGNFEDLAFSKIPVGLENYYQDHWLRMRGKVDVEEWLEYRLPVIVALTVVREAVNIHQISEFSYIDSKSRIRQVLSDFQNFLYVEDEDPKRYRWYHASFHDFISAKNLVKDEHIDLREAHGKVASFLLKSFDSIASASSQ